VQQAVAQILRLGPQIMSNARPHNHASSSRGAKESYRMNFSNLVADICQLSNSGQAAAAKMIDHLLTLRSWLIGAWIVEYEQGGEDRAAYGEGLFDKLAEELSRSGLSGMSARNLKNFRQVALTWPDLDPQQTLQNVIGPIRQSLTAESSSGENSSPEAVLVVRSSTSFPALQAKIVTLNRLLWQDAAWTEKLFQSLTFTHLIELSRLDLPMKRAFYELQTIKEGWTVREMKRQIQSMLYERVGLSRDKDAMMVLAKDGKILETPNTILRDPYVLEFLGLPTPNTFSETELESALLAHLQDFLHELGRDFCFVDRQLRITVGGEHHHLDLLFFHRGLRCLVAIDLKIGDFDHRDAGQMHFYLNYIAENLTKPEEAPPVGLLLCAGKDAEKVHYATANLPHSVFVARYLTVLPSEEQLARWLHEERVRLSLIPSSNKKS
jgi:predicted nuclease of restriction endonuclease-like (RecB) superfamily